MEEWKNIVKQRNIVYAGKDVPCIDIMLKNKKPNRIFYANMIRSKQHPPAERFSTWEKELGETFWELEWYDNIYEIMKICKETKLKSFAYNFCLRNVYTNTLLYKMKYVNTDLCTFCGLERETIIHLFDRCTVSRRLWERLKQKLELCLGLEVELNIVKLLFDNEYLNDTQERLIWIMIKCLQYIYNAKYLEKIPTYGGFWAHLMYIERIERNTATSHKKLTDHFLKWVDLM